MKILLLLAMTVLAGPEEDKAASGQRFLETSGSGSLADEAVFASAGPWQSEQPPLAQASTGAVRGFKTNDVPAPGNASERSVSPSGTPAQVAVLTAKGAVYGGAGGGVAGSVFGPGGAVAGAIAGAFLGALAGFLMGGKPADASARRKELEQVANL